MKKLFYETEEFLKEKVEKIESKIFASVVNNYNTIATSLRGCHSTIKTSCNATEWYRSKYKTNPWRSVDCQGS